mmetsp:Transcript_30593/g.73862  ORF Transcript_30593/g.73862 Transcript_30593/m.73862 type:complete len:266 (-) Transcript_30593:225-1022(-)
MIRAVREWELWEYGRRLRWHGASTSRGQGTASSMPHCRCEIYVPPLLGEGLCSGALRRAEVDSIRAGSDDEEEEGADACGLPWDYTDLRNNAYEKKNCAGEEEDVSTNDLCDPDGRCSHPCPPRCCDRRMVAVAPPWHRDERRAAAAVDDAAVARRGEEADDDDEVAEAAADRGGRSRHWGEEYSAGTDTPRHWTRQHCGRGGVGVEERAAAAVAAVRRSNIWEDPSDCVLPPRPRAAAAVPAASFLRPLPPRDDDSAAVAVGRP